MTEREDRQGADRRIAIEALGTYVPAEVLTTAAVVAGCRRPLRFPLERMTGIRSRRAAGRTEFGFELALRAALRCLSVSRHAAEDVDLLVSVAVGHCDAPGLSITVEPSTAVRLQQHLGCHRAVAFDLASACTGMFVGIHIAEAMIRAGSIRRALVVSGEYITHLTPTAQQEIEGYLDPRMACLTVGDAGAAVLVEAAERDGAGFHALGLKTLGQYSDCCVGKPTDAPHGGAIMHTDALRLTEAGARHGAEHAVQTLAAAGWPPSSFDHLIMHQTSATALAGAMTEINRRLGGSVCRPDNTVDNLAERGNTASTTHFLALDEAMASGRVRAGERLVFAISGSGLTVGTGLYVLDDLPERVRSAGPGAPRLPPSRRASAKARRTVPRGGTGARVASVGLTTPSPTSRPTTRDMLREATADCLARAGRGPEGVDLLLHAGIHRSEFVVEPAIAALLAGDLGTSAAPGLLAFDVANGDLGFLDACHVAVEAIRSGLRRSALVVTSEVENNLPIWPEAALGLEETGAALLLEACPAADGGFLEFLFRSRPEHAEAYASRCVNRDGRAHLEVRRPPDWERLLLEAAVGAGADLLASVGLAIDDVDWVLPPQRSAAFLEEVAARLGAPRARVIDAVRGRRDLSTASIPAALRRLEEEASPRPGALALLLAAGSGLQAGAALYRFPGLETA